MTETSIRVGQLPSVHESDACYCAEFVLKPMERQCPKVLVKYVARALDECYGRAEADRIVTGTEPLRLACLSAICMVATLKRLKGMGDDDRLFPADDGEYGERLVRDIVALMQKRGYVNGRRP